MQAGQWHTHLQRLRQLKRRQRQQQQLQWWQQ
jgi:hypothetical protein